MSRLQGKEGGDGVIYTKGPWIYEESDEGHVIKMGEAIMELGERRRKGIVGTLSHHKVEYNHGCYYEDDGPENAPCNIQALEAEGNARLIAAAPELFEACKLACEYYEMLENATGVEHGVLKELRQAIAKAEGTPPEGVEI